jgi:plasmid stabilization system protein ParE
VSSAAEYDIERIAVYTSKEWGEDQMRSVLSAIRSAFEHIARFPCAAKGSNKPNIFVQKVHGLPFIVVFEVVPNGVTILQVLHDRQNRL